LASSYDTSLIVVSVIVAMLASFTGFNFAARSHIESGPTRKAWLVAAAIAMGLGMWSAHAIGLLAFERPASLEYDVPLMLLSMMIAILGSLVSFVLINGRRPRSTTILSAAFVMGAALLGMVYAGVASIRMDGTPSYGSTAVVMSAITALIGSMAAIWLTTRVPNDVTVEGALSKIAGAITMGVAIAGTHYIGIAATRFTPNIGIGVTDSHILSHGHLDEVVVAGGVLIIILAVVGAMLQRNMYAAQHLIEQLREQALLTRKSEEQYRLLFDSNPNSMWVYDDTTLAFLAVNEAAVRSYGYSRDEFLGMTRNDVRVGSGEERPASVNALATGGVAAPSWEGRHRKHDGTIVDVVVASHLIAFDSSSACLALVVDVTENKKAEEALRQSEQRTHVILDNALDAVISMNASGVITDWNAQAERIFGWPRAEALGRRMSDTIIPERYRERHESGLKKFLLTGEGSVLNKRIEISALDRSGREFPVELAISPAKVTEEWAFSAFIRDLTERKEAETALRAGEKRYRELFENSPIGLYTSTPDGALLDVNSAMVSMFGYPDRESLLAVSATSLYLDPAEREEWLAQQTSEIDVLDVDVRLLRRDGTTIWARDTTHVKRGVDGFVVLYEGALEDITDRVKAESALQANERRLTQILEAVPLGILVSDSEGRIMFVNAAAQQILGQDIVADASVTDLARVYNSYVAGTNDIYPIERNPIARALAGEAFAVDDVEIREGGRIISLSVQGAPILNSEGAIVAAALAFSDVTEKKALEGQLRQSSKMEAVGQLAGGVAHDFNNLLTVIMSYGSMLLDRLGPEDESREDVQEIAAAAVRAAGLTRQLLAFSRQQVLQPRVVNINAVIIDVEKMLRRIIGEDVELQTSLAPDLAAIHADPGQLEQILMNLVVNARDAMSGGGRVCISTSNAELPADPKAGAPFNAGGPCVILSVSDTGAGMTPDILQRIFDPFFTTKAPGYGTGLGLSTVYGIVKQSGGEIHVDSELGAGSTITLYFPRFTGSAQTLADVVMPSASSCGSETILLVEDDANLRSLVARVLTGRGYRVHMADTGVAGLAIASDPLIQLDAVIADVVMPGMNGRELVEKLLAANPGLGCLFMSGYTDDEILRRGVSRGEAAFLQKPFTPDQLAQSLRSVLDHTVAVA
jgi:two-component system, cell cycle sensor histidine kinase and response regulator CckA